MERWLAARLSAALGVSEEEMVPFARQLLTASHAAGSPAAAQAAPSPAHSHSSEYAMAHELHGLLGEHETRRLMEDFQRQKKLLSPFQQEKNFAAAAAVGESKATPTTTTSTPTPTTTTTTTQKQQSSSPNKPKPKKKAPAKGAGGGGGGGNSIRFISPTTTKTTTTKTTTTVVPLEQGRCECLASVHALVGNCLTCGKILCVAEVRGDTPTRTCTFCGTQLLNSKQRKQQSRKKEQQRKTEKVTYRTKVGGYGAVLSVEEGTAVDAVSSGGVGGIEATTENNVLQQELMASFPKLENASAVVTATTTTTTMMTDADEEAASIRKAEEHKRRLLEFDRADAARTQIHDAAEDFQAVSADSWLTPEERALAMRHYQDYQRQRQEAATKVRITLDLDSMQVVREAVEQVDKPSLAAILRDSRHSRNRDDDKKRRTSQEEDEEDDGDQDRPDDSFVPQFISSTSNTSFTKKREGGATSSDQAPAARKPNPPTPPTTGNHPRTSLVRGGGAMVVLDDYRHEEFALYGGEDADGGITEALE